MEELLLLCISNTVGADFEFPSAIPDFAPCQFNVRKRHSYNIDSLGGFYTLYLQPAVNHWDPGILEARICTNRILQLVCREARDEIQRQFPAVLSLSNGGTMRYSPEKDVMRLPHLFEYNEQSWYNHEVRFHGSWHELVQNFEVTARELSLSRARATDRDPSGNDTDLVGSTEASILELLIRFPSLKRMFVTTGVPFSVQTMHHWTDEQREKNLQDIRACYGWFSNYQVHPPFGVHPGPSKHLFEAKAPSEAQYCCVGFPMLIRAIQDTEPWTGMVGSQRIREVS